MASLPADKDYARSVLAIFGLKNVRARESLPLNDIEAAFLVQNMGRPADLEAALLYATSQGWLARALDRVRLTTRARKKCKRFHGPFAAPIRSRAARARYGKGSNACVSGALARARPLPRSILLVIGIDRNNWAATGFLALWRK